MANLYELTTEYAELVDQYEMADNDEQRAEILAAIGAVQGDIGDKAEAYARIIRNMQADADAYKAESQRLANKQRAAERAVEGLKARLLNAMTAVGASEIRTDIGKWRIQMNPWSVRVLDDAAVPAEYHIPQPDKIDKAGILKRFKETGELLNGVEVTQVAGLRFR